MSDIGSGWGSDVMFVDLKKLRETATKALDSATEAGKRGGMVDIAIVQQYLEEFNPNVALVLIDALEGTTKQLKDAGLMRQVNSDPSTGN